MNTIVQLLNTAGRAFVEFAVPMLIQSSLLVVILLAVDGILRKRVRAVFRYWIWMLVLVKLVLPTSLWSPVSVGTWFGDKIEVSTTALLETPEPSPAESRPVSPSSLVTNLLSRPQRVFVESAAPASAPPAETANQPAPVDRSSVLSLQWQGFVLLLWSAIVMALLLLLAQRTFFVCGLVAQADEASQALQRELDLCRRQMGLRWPSAIRSSPNAASPAVCGLWRPVILVPQNLAARLHGADLQAVLYHELAHVQRGDLWVNLAQTLLQILYFYHPLLWLANTIIRRIREQAVDETVLVALGEEAPQYPQTLVNVAKLAFMRPPALSLRLIGVVESKSALTSRIKHILNRPIPTTARLGLVGLAAIAVVAAVLLPMAAAKDRAQPSADAAGVSVDSDGDGLSDYEEVHKYLTDPTKKDTDGDGIPDGDWNERREYTYSVRTVLRYLPPADEKALRDDFQDGRVLKQTSEYVEVEVIHYPLATGFDSIAENRNWRQDDASLREYLAPGATTNWDPQMQRDLIGALKADGIDVETLSDKQVVEQVSRWLLKRSRSLDNVFTTYYVDFPQGKPAVYPGLEDAFRREFERDSRKYDWTLDQHLDHEVLGKGMFYHKTHGSCTSTAIYLTTVLRALGIPTRIVLVTPAVDTSDRAQILLVKKSLTHNRVRETMLAGLRRSSHGFTNHTLNEVYVGGRWRRLDYDQLGRPAFGADRFGLQTHVYTLRDWSDANLAPTWGVRYAKGEHNEIFRHDNPYTTLEISDLFGTHAHLDNPPFSAQVSSPNSRPNVFLFYPGKVYVWDEFIKIVENSTWDKTGRPHEKEFYDNIFEEVWTTKPGDILVLLFSLDTPERIPAGYEDLLPQPWPEIEAQLKQGRTVELGTKVRDKSIILLAAPTAEGLKSLLQNSRLLRTLGGADPVPSVGSASPSLVPLASPLVEFAGGLKIQLLGVCEHPSEGKSWWQPDGSPLEKTPYRAIGSRLTHVEGFREFEYAARVWGGQDPDVQWSVPGGGHASNTGRAPGEDGRQLADVFAFMNNQPPEAGTTNVLLGVAAGEWNTRAVHQNPGTEGFYSLSDDRNLEIGFSPAETRQGDTYVPTTMNFGWDELSFRVVAVDSAGTLHEGGASGYGGLKLHSLTYRFPLPLGDIKEFRLQTRSRKWIAFRNVSLRPGRKTQVQGEFLTSPDAFRADAPGPAPVVGTDPEIVLPEVDRQQVALDLATGALIPLPPVGPEPQKLEQALRKLGKGDLLYDCDSGDRTLILVRGATSEQAQGDTGEPPWKGYLIGPHLPGTLTIKTIEGRQYRVTIRAADEKACTLKYSPVPTDKGAGGGALAGPGQVPPLELRIVPRRDQLEVSVVKEYEKVLAEGRMAPGGHYVWVPVRPGVNLPSFAITQTHEGKTWLLVHNDDPFVMVPSQGWRLAHVGRGTDANGRPMVTLEFDDAGAARLLQLTKANDGKLLAEIVEGIVVSAPVIRAGQSGFSKAAIPGNFTEQQVDDLVATLRRGMTAPPAAPQGLSGRVVDPNGRPVAGAQVGLSTDKIGVVVSEGKLQQPRGGDKEKGQVVETDGEGRFRFEGQAPESFDLIAAHEAGFAVVGSEVFQQSGQIRLEKWGRIEGQLASGRQAQDNQIMLAGMPNETWLKHRRQFRYQTRCDAAGKFTFDRVPAGWFEVGYLKQTGEVFSSPTSRTPVVVKTGATTQMKLGGEGWPVMGRFVPPAGYSGPVYFGAGLRALATVRPEQPKPANYDQMTKREQQDWYRQWRNTPQYQAYSDAVWHDPNWRHYTFRIAADGSFRIEDVIPGRYDLTVWLEERFTGQGRPQEIGAYNGTIEVPAIPGGRTEEPLDLGNLTVSMRKPPLQAGEMAPLFEAKTLDGKDLRLSDSRGKFVLLSFWQPVYDPELGRLQELYESYGRTGRLQIIGLGGWDTPEEVRKYVAEHKTEWPQIYVGTDVSAGIAGQYGLPGVPYLLLLNPEGKIVTTELRGEKLTETVRKTLGPPIS